MSKGDQIFLQFLESPAGVILGIAVLCFLGFMMWLAFKD